MLKIPGTKKFKTINYNIFKNIKEQINNIVNIYQKENQLQFNDK